MSGICGIAYLKEEHPEKEIFVRVMKKLIKHRGGVISTNEAYEIDGSWTVAITANNYSSEYVFNRAENYQHIGIDGAFAIVHWNNKTKKLRIAVDHLGLYPLYYYFDRIGSAVYFASEVKALLPFITIKVKEKAIHQYLTFHTCLDNLTMFDGVYRVMPGEIVECWLTGADRTQYYLPNQHKFKHKEDGVIRTVTGNLINAIGNHSKDRTGFYVSGGLDSSTVASIAGTFRDSVQMVHGHFNNPAYDEIEYAKSVHEANEHALFHPVIITAQDFVDNIDDVIYHMDYPEGGVGVFSQYMTAKHAASLGFRYMFSGSGGDELFGGYVRYLIAYFEQCIKGAITGTLHKGNFVVTYESIMQNLHYLDGYQPLLSQFWSQGLFGRMDDRYFRLINRGIDNSDWLYEEQIKEFRRLFQQGVTPTGSYLDAMQYFDFMNLLPGLIHVEDRVNGAFGIEQISPILNKWLVDFMFTVPADIRLKNGQLKYVLKEAAKPYIPTKVYERKSKMGFPTPLSEWFRLNESGVRDIIIQTLSKGSAMDYINNQEAVMHLNSGGEFTRQIWGLYMLEAWFQRFIIRGNEFANLIEDERNQR